MATNLLSLSLSWPWRGMGSSKRSCQDLLYAALVAVISKQKCSKLHTLNEYVCISTTYGDLSSCIIPDLLRPIFQYLLPASANEPRARRQRYRVQDVRFGLAWLRRLGWSARDRCVHSITQLNYVDRLCRLLRALFGADYTSATRPYVKQALSLTKISLRSMLGFEGAESANLQVKTGTSQSFSNWAPKSLEIMAENNMHVAAHFSFICPRPNNLRQAWPDSSKNVDFWRVKGKAGDGSARAGSLSRATRE